MNSRESMRHSYSYPQKTYIQPQFLIAQTDVLPLYGMPCYYRAII